MSGTYSTSSYKLIYIFTIPDKAHEGLVKVGEATIHTTAKLDELPPNCDALRAAAEQNRIKSYTFTAGIKVDLHWAQLAIRTKQEIYAGSQITVIDNFRDHDVHDVLKNSGIVSSCPNGVKNREWFKCDVETAKRAITAVIEYRSVLAESEKSFAPAVPVIKLRDEQEDAVQKTLRIFKTSDEVLWNCKMRFGKTLTAYELIRRGKFQKTIVVTHRPVVQDGWEEDHGKLFGENSTHLFMKKQGNFYTEDYFDSSSDINNDIALNNARRRGDSFTYFASMQDLRGSKLVDGKFDKNKAVFDMDWDLIIYDEAHEGTQTQLGQKVQSLLEQPKNGKTPKVLELSGTPYNIMDKYEDNVCTWDYVMEQEAKARWDYEHPDEPNPYADMPRMNIFTFDMSKALPTSYRFETETSAFNFREFFRVWTGDPKEDFGAIPQGKEVGDFVHEQDVRSFLNIISTESKDTKYPFATHEFRQEFKHTFWMVPGIKEARALSALLQRHAVFSHYKVVNVAGEGDVEMPYDNALSLVKKAIRENPYTITLSCGKLTTGVTVREWTAVMMLTGGATTDAKGYMQTIFRVQSAGLIDGKQKENCYVFDFAPDRALRVISEAHQLSKRGKLSDTQYKTELGKFLNYCPVHAIEGVRMTPYDVNSMMRQIKRISVDSAIKSGFDDDSIYKVDTGIVMDDRDREFFDALKSRLNGQKKAQRETKVTLADNGMSQEEYDRAKKAERKPPRERTPEEKAAMEKLKAQKKQRDTFIALLRNISIRLPLLIYGADVPLTENITMEKFTEIVDDESWKEFLPADVTKDLFKRSIKYFDEDVLIGAGLRIRRLVKQADEYPPTERIRRITELFGHFRNPDKETVLTPWRVVNMHMSDCVGGYCFLNEKFDAKEPLEEPRYVVQDKVTSDLFSNPHAKILEINSKSGLYPLYIAYSIYRNRLSQRKEDMTLGQQYEVWNEVLRDNVFVLCKTKMAQAITRRTLAGFGDAATNTRYQAHLVEKLQSDMDWVVKKIKNPESWKKEGTEMKFDAIVGNPPYQVMDGGAQASATPVYNLFVEAGKKLAPEYLSMIMPSRWMTGGKGLDKFRLAMIRDKHILKLTDYFDATTCFPNVEIKGGVCYFLRNKDIEDKCDVITHTNDSILHSHRYLCESDDEFFIRDNRLISIKEKVAGLAETMFDTLVSAMKPYGIRGDAFKDTEKYGLPEFSSEVIEDGYSIIGLDEKLRRVVKYMDKSYPLPKRDMLHDYKIFITRNYGNGELGEIPSAPILAQPGMACTETFVQIGPFSNQQQMENCFSYMKTKFFRLMVGIKKRDQGAGKTVYSLVPIQDFTEQSNIDWSKPISEIDAQLYAKYNLTPDEISFIESTIKPME